MLTTARPAMSDGPLFDSHLHRAWQDILFAQHRYLVALYDGDDPARIAVVGPKVGEALARLPDARDANRG